MTVLKVTDVFAPLLDPPKKNRLHDVITKITVRKDTHPSFIKALHKHDLGTGPVPCHSYLKNGLRTIVVGTFKEVDKW